MLLVERWLPESARWLIANGKAEEACVCLRRCAEMNKCKADFTPEVEYRAQGNIFWLMTPEVEYRAQGIIFWLMTPVIYFPVVK